MACSLFLGPCEDEDPVGCMFAAKYDGCSLKRGEMTNICRKSCDACGKIQCYTYLSSFFLV